MHKIMARVFGLVGVGFFLSGGGLAHAQHQFGFNLGLGAPYLMQAGLEYAHPSKKLSVDVGYNQLSIDMGDVSVALKKPELSVRWFPWARAFFVGAGVGKFDLDLSATDTVGLNPVTIEINFGAMALTPKLGWLWGYSGGGFFGGVDLGLQIPLNTSSNVTTNADPAVQATQDYQDLLKSVTDAEKILGETMIPVVGLIRIGYLF